MKSLMKESKCKCTLGARSYQWRRRVKRKVEDVYYEVGRDSYNAEVEVELLSELIALKEALRRQQKTIDELSSELDEERNAAASAADEAMTMISRLQKEKAEVHMEGSQFRRYAEGKFAHDQEELGSLENSLYRKDQMIKALEFEIQSLNHRILSIGCLDFETTNIGSPERFRSDDGEDHCYLPEYSFSGRNSSVEQTASFDVYDGQRGGSAPGQVKETNIGRIYVDKSNDTPSSSQLQLDWEDTYSPKVLRGQEIGSSPFNPLQSDDYLSSSQLRGHTSNGMHGYHKSDVHDPQNIAKNTNEKALEDVNVSLWECIERLEERVQQLEKGTHSQNLDSERIEARKLPPKKLAAYSASTKKGSEFLQGLSSDSVNSSDKLVETSEESSDEDDGLLSVKANNSYSRKKGICSQQMENESDRKCSTSNIFEDPNDTAGYGCKPIKGNSDCLGKCNSLPQKHEACIATKRVLHNEQPICLPSSREGSKSPQMLSSDIIKESISDVPDVPNEAARSGRCKALKRNWDWYGDPGPELSPRRHNGHIPESTPDITEREGKTATACPTILRAESDLGPVQSNIKQLIVRIQALEEERQCMKQAIQYFERENSSCLTLLKEIARQHYEVQMLDKSKHLTKRMTPSEGLSILSMIKWILSCIFRRNAWGCQNKYIHGLSSHSVGLLFLLDNTSNRRLGTVITRA